MIDPILIIATIIGLSGIVVCAFQLYSKSSKPLYIVPKLLIVSLISDFFVISLIFIQSVPTLNNNELTTAVIIFALAVANMALMISASIALELLIRSSVSRQRLVFVSFLTGNVISLGIGMIFTTLGTDESADILITIESIFIAVGLIYWIIVSISDLRSPTPSINPLKETSWIRYLIYTVGLIIPLVLMAIFFTMDPSKMIISFNALFLILVANFFRKQKTLRFLFPSFNNILLVSDTVGGVKFSFNLSHQYLSEGRISLLTGWSNAISHVLSEFFEEEAKPEYIELGRYRIYSKWTDAYMLAFITDQQSILYREAIQQMNILIQQKYGKELKSIFRKPHPIDLEDLALIAFDFIIQETPSR